MRKPTIPQSFGKARASNPPNRSSAFSSLLGSNKLAKERMRFARALARKSGKRTGMVTAINLHAEAARAIPVPRRVRK